MTQDVQTLEQMLHERFTVERRAKIEKALEGVWAAISEGNGDWVDYHDRQFIAAEVWKTAKKHEDRLWQWYLKKFMDTYSKILADFPQLADQAREEGAEEARQDVER